MQTALRTAWDGAQQGANVDTSDFEGHVHDMIVVTNDKVVLVMSVTTVLVADIKEIGGMGHCSCMMALAIF